MSDPVDTGALRAQRWHNVDELVEWATAAADEVDRLRDRLHHVEHWTAPEAIRMWTKERAVNDRLRAVIENAPHDRLCLLYTWQQVWGDCDGYAHKCTCWKADAL